LSVINILCKIIMINIHAVTDMLYSRTEQNDESTFFNLLMTL
jgi:hypothetical protein